MCVLHPWIWHRMKDNDVSAYGSQMSHSHLTQYSSCSGTISCFAGLKILKKEVMPPYKYRFGSYLAKSITQDSDNLK